MTKSVEYMPFFVSLASFANGVCWVSYALKQFDLFIAAYASTIGFPEFNSGSDIALSRQSPAKELYRKDRPWHCRRYTAP